MEAMLLEAPGRPLQPATLPIPEPGPGQLLLRVRACGVCRTDLHIADGDLPRPKLPLVLGHEIVGEVAAVGGGPDANVFRSGERVGVPWLAWTCGECRYCRAGRENLCERARFTRLPGERRYAEYTVADARFCFRLPPTYSDQDAAPLLCAGLIGYRALRAAGDGGAAGHLRIRRRGAYRGPGRAPRGTAADAFTRPDDVEAQRFARELGAEWAGPSTEVPPEPLDGAIIFAPVGALVPAALRAVGKAGIVVCAGIHMSPIPSFPYEILWEERAVRSVANLTRRDGEEFLRLAEEVPLRIATEPRPLQQGNEALDRLRHGRLRGAAVLVPAGGSPTA